MGVTRLWFEAELRRHWRRQVTLTLLVAFVGVAVLTCVAAARRTDSSFHRYATAQGLPQLEVFSGSDRRKTPAVVKKIEAIPGVAATGRYNNLFAAPDRPGVFPGQDFLVFAPGDDAYSRTVDRPILLAGRLPRPDAPDEVLVNERAAHVLGFHVGSRTRLRAVSPKEGEALLAGNFDAIKFRGATPTVTVVGIGRSRADLYQLSYAPQYFIATHAFYERNVDNMFGFGELVDIRVDPGANVERVAKQVDKAVPRTDQTGGVTRLDEGAKGLKDAARAQAIALFLVALTALVAGAIAISQAIARSIAGSAPDYATLTALGVDRPRRVRMSASTFVPSAVVAAALAVVAAWAASRWFPTGTSRGAEVSLGAQFDARVLLLGAVVIVVGVVARAVIGTWRQSLAGAQQQKAQHSVWLDRVTATLAPPAATGVRWALGRRDGTQAQSRAGLFGAMIGVAGLLAVVMYTTGLDYVVSTPSAYGWTFDASAGGGDDPSQIGPLRDFVVQQKSIDDVAIVDITGDVPIKGAVLDQAWAYRDVRGSIGPEVVQGRAPAGDDEVMLGTKTAAALGLHVGDVLHIPRVKGPPAALRVVGYTLFPTIETDRFTRGVVVTPATFAQLRNGGGYQNVVFRWRPGTDVTKELARLRKERDLSGALPAPASDVANLRAVRDYPRWLAAFLVVLGILATTHTLVVSTRRRRHEMGVLRAIGFSRRQVSRAVSVHGATIGVVAVAVGVPVGLAVGRWVWVAHAQRIGLGTTISAPVVTVVVIALGAVVLTWLIATAAGRRASRTRLTTALRVE